MNKKKKEKIVFVCQNCGYDSPRWSGRCPNCGEWNTLVEEKISPSGHGGRERTGAAPAHAVPLKEIERSEVHRIRSASGEFDRVLGGGLVPGSLLLFGGDPGIGKSTLLLQRLADYAGKGEKVLYVSGEESGEQIVMRAERLGVDPANIWILAEVNLVQILAEMERLQPRIVVIDSIQTMFHPDFESAPGSITQVRECAMSFLQTAKSRKITVLMVGHVTKEGAIAGPRVLEHMVDGLLFLEGDRQYQYRVLRGIKNRFGSTNEIGIFELTETGLAEVKNPSQLFLSAHREQISGSAVTCSIEGTRPILLEVQALTTPASFGMPQRTAGGIDHKRLALLLAILEKRGGYRVSAADVFVKIAGGLRVDDPSADLAIILAVAAAHRDVVLPPDALFLGEVGLGGEIRPVSQLEKRLREADLLGFRHAFIPKQKLRPVKLAQLRWTALEHVQQALEMVE